MSDEGYCNCWLSGEAYEGKGKPKDCINGDCKLPMPTGYKDPPCVISLLFKRRGETGFNEGSPITGLDINMLFSPPIGAAGADEDTVIAAGGDAAIVTCPGGAAKFCDEGVAITVLGGEASAKYTAGA